MEENLLHDRDEEFPERALEEEEEDPTVAAFLDLLADDIEKHPERQGIPEELLRSILELTESIEVDLDEPIKGPVALQAVSRTP